MRVVLFMPHTLSMDSTTPPMSLLMLAAVVEREHDVRIVFPIDFDAMMATLPASLADADVVGVSINSFNWYRARQTIGEIRRHFPQLRIVIGGPHPTHCDRHCLETSAADVAVRGEGEATFPDLLGAWAAGRDADGIKGLTWKDRDGAIHVNPERELISAAELDALPLPAYHLVPPQRYGFVPMETSRGCRYRCVFCGIPTPRGIRQFSLARVERNLRQLAALRDRFVQDGIFLCDDSFSAHRERVVGTLELLRTIMPDAMIGCEARISELQRDDLFLQFAANRVFLIQVGVECGYQAGLRRIKKGLTLDMIQDFAVAATRLPFRYQIYWSYMIGFPWETASEVVQTINFAFDTARAAGSQQPQLNVFSPYPGSDIAARPERYGLSPPTPALYDDPAWFSQFVGYSRVAPADRPALQTYLLGIHRSFPRHRALSVLRLPTGAIVDLGGKSSVSWAAT
ncbi:MAG: B12-binding domain-containing radical SAM protein, partial [Xanthobacteraceae bacterium]